MVFYLDGGRRRLFIFLMRERGKAYVAWVARTRKGSRDG